MGYRGPAVAEGGEGGVEDVHDMNAVFHLLGNEQCRVLRIKQLSMKWMYELCLQPHIRESR